MAKAKSLSATRIVSKPKGTSIGDGHFKTASLNKRKKASYKKYRGQGR